MFYSMIVETILHSLFLFKFKIPVGNLFLPLQSSDELLPFGASQQGGSCATGPLSSATLAVYGSFGRLDRPLLLHRQEAAGTKRLVAQKKHSDEQRINEHGTCNFGDE